MKFVKQKFQNVDWTILLEIIIGDRLFELFSVEILVLLVIYSEILIPSFITQDEISKIKLVQNLFDFS